MSWNAHGRHKFCGRGTAGALDVHLRCPSTWLRSSRREAFPCRSMRDFYVGSVSSPAAPLLSLTIDNGALEDLWLRSAFAASRTRWGRYWASGVSSIGKHNAGHGLLIAEEICGDKMRKCVVVVGYVKDEASMRHDYHQSPISTNGLVHLAAAKQTNVQIVCTPRPDVLTRVRRAKSDPVEDRRLSSIATERLPLTEAAARHRGCDCPLASRFWVGHARAAAEFPARWQAQSGGAFRWRLSAVYSLLRPRGSRAIVRRTVRRCDRKVALAIARHVGYTDPAGSCGRQDLTAAVGSASP